MENLEDKLEEAGALQRFWIRYVDDAIIKREEAATILEELNRAYRGIDFTMEIEKEWETPFLDLKIIRKRGDFESDIYRKPTQTERTIIYTSNHDFHHKMGAYNFMIHNGREKRIQQKPHRKLDQKETAPGLKTATFNTLPGSEHRT